MNLNRRTLLTGAPALALTTTALTSTGLTPAQAATNFRDVPPGTQFYREIMWMRSSGISTGWADNTYRPLDVVRRDAMAAFLYRVAGAQVDHSLRWSPFTDIRYDSPFAKEIMWMGYEGVSSGTNGYYLPHQPVKRDAMAAFIYRVAGHPFYTPPARSPFRDITPSTQFYKEMCWMKDAGISTGYPDGTYRPLEPVRRDAMAAFLYRLKHNPPKFPVRMGLMHTPINSGTYRTFTDFDYWEYKNPALVYKYLITGNPITYKTTVNVPAGSTHFTTDVKGALYYSTGRIRILSNGREIGALGNITNTTNRTFSVPLNGARTLEIESTASGRSGSGGHIVLGDSRFERR